MPFKDYKPFDPADALVPGYYSLVLTIYFKNSKQFLKVALASSSSPFQVPFLPSALTLDLEPVSAQEICIFYRWETSVFDSLKAILVLPKKVPQKGKIRVDPEASQHAFTAGFEVESFEIRSIGSGPLGGDIKP
ncbi:TPA_asm: matrix protein [Bombay duck fish bornavirus]|uniref:Matrix protein n=1 Tax=Bombay duck fish bornavirus TaxID=3067899 RepID=A0AA48SFL5_9MONO|nr:TPA_asm: matrix protein [Bombay duck fish bornavirus]